MKKIFVTAFLVVTMANSSQIDMNRLRSENEFLKIRVEELEAIIEEMSENLRFCQMQLQHCEQQVDDGVVSNDSLDGLLPANADVEFLLQDQESDSDYLPHNRR